MPVFTLGRRNSLITASFYRVSHQPPIVRGPHFSAGALPSGKKHRTIQGTPPLYTRSVVVVTTRRRDKSRPDPCRHGVPFLGKRISRDGATTRHECPIGLSDAILKDAQHELDARYDKNRCSSTFFLRFLSLRELETSPSFKLILGEKSKTCYTPDDGKSHGPGLDTTTIIMQKTKMAYFRRFCPC